MPDDRYDRERNERLATWRGDIERRMVTVEESMREVLKAAKHTDETVIRMEGRLAAVKRDLSECRVDIAKAADLIDRGRDSAVEELKDTINARDAQGEAWRLSKFQVFVGGALAFLCSITAAVITAALGGAFS